MSANDLRKCPQINFRRGLNACIKLAARRLLKRPHVILAMVLLRRQGSSSQLEPDCGFLNLTLILLTWGDRGGAVG